MEQNNVRTYIFYAVGEILLVVIGILLALQVNNWNEERKAHEFERTILTQLRSAVIEDLDFIGNHLLNLRTKRKLQAHYYFDRMLKGEPVDRDSLDLHFGWLRFTDQFQYNRGPYESIKSAGIDKISNDSLRNVITNTYDFFLPRETELIEWSYLRHEKTVEETYPKLVNPPSVFIEEGDVEIRKTRKNFDFNSDPHFLELLSQSKFMTSWVEQGYQRVKERLQELNHMIDNELNK